MPNTIPGVQARRTFTKNLIDVFQDRKEPTTFLTSGFRVVETSGKTVSIEVQRTEEFVADDVERGTEGNRNEFSSFSEKQWTPPYFREYFDATDFDFYDQMFGKGDVEVDDMQFTEWIEQANEKVQLLKDKIERRYEIFRGEVLQTGTLTFKTAENVDFHRKANSIVDLGAGAGYIDNPAVNPFDPIKVGCEFIVTEGKYGGSEFNIIAGGEAIDRLKDNPNFIDRANLRWVKLIDMQTPTSVKQNGGGSYHGTFTAGSYTIHLWAYPQFYKEKSTGLYKPYIEQRNMIILPMEPRFKMSYAGVPKIMKDERNGEFPEFIQNQRGQFNVGNYIDPRMQKHVIDVASAGMPVPVALDQIYTINALAAA